jgi:hypothetical protein
MVQDRLEGGEPLQAHQFLAVELSVRLAELGVTFVREPAELVIDGHRSLLTAKRADDER